MNKLRCDCCGQFISRAIIDWKVWNKAPYNKLIWHYCQNCADKYNKGEDDER